MSSVIVSAASASSPARPGLRVFEDPGRLLGRVSQSGSM